MAMSVEQIAKKAWKGDIARCENVRVIKSSLKNTPSGVTLNSVTKDTEKGEVRTHQQRVYCVDPTWQGKLTAAPKGVKVSCDCARFMYTFEYALHLRGAADIIYGDGSPPLQTNPGARPGVCKHLILALLAILKAKA